MSTWPSPIYPLQHPFPSITDTLVVSCVFLSLAKGSFAIVFYYIYLAVSFFHEGGREFNMRIDRWKGDSALVYSLVFEHIIVCDAVLQRLALC